MNHIVGKQFIDELDLTIEAYTFDVVGLWRDEKGFYLGTDSGCSCPIPWESHTEDDLTGPLTLDQVVEETTSLWQLSHRPASMDQLDDFFLSAMQSFREELDTDWATDRPENLHFYSYVRLTDTNGKEWVRNGKYEDYVSDDREEATAYDLETPVKILEARK